MSENRRGGSVEADTDTARLFVAVTLPAMWIDALATQQARLRATLPDLRYVRPESVHLTLAFLGAVPGAKIAPVADALDRAAARAVPLSVRLDAVGFFGRRGRGERHEAVARIEVIWAGVGGDREQLRSLARMVSVALSSLGVAVDRREFRPHLTLARVPPGRGIEQTAIIEAIRALPPPTAPPLRVSSIALMRSYLERGGARHTELRRARLGAAADAQLHTEN